MTGEKRRRFWLSVIIDEYRQAFSGLPREIWLLASVMLINRAGTMVVAFLALYFTQSLGFEATSAAKLLAIYGVGAIVGAYVGGKLTDRIGAIRVQIISLALTAVGFIVLSLVRDWTQTAAVSFFVSLVSEAIRPANATAVTLYSPPSRHRQAFALTRLAANLGMTLGPALGGFLATISYSYLFWADAGTCAVAGILLFVLFRRVANPISDRSDQEPENEGKGISPWRDGAFLIFLSLTFVSALVFFQLLSTYPHYLKYIHQLSEFEIGLLLAVNTLLVALAEMVLIRRLGGFSELKTIAVGYFLSCVGFGMMPFGAGFGYFAFCVCVWTIGEMISMPLASAYVAGRSTQANRGSYMGGYTICYAVAFVVAPLIGFQLYQWSPNAVWHFCTAVGVVLLVATWSLAEWENRQKDRAASDND